jgi:hypothetical protein
MARILSVTFETEAQARPGHFSVPQRVADVLGIGPGDVVELSIMCGGLKLELRTQLRSGLEVYFRVGDESTAGLQQIPPRAPLEVTIWVPEGQGAVPPTSSTRPRIWTEADVFAALSNDPVATRVARDLISWATDRRLRVVGTKLVSPTLAWHLDALRTDYYFFNLDTGFKQVNIEFNVLKNKPVLNDPSRRAALVAALNQVYPIPPERADKVPSIQLAAMADEAAFRAFTAAWDAVIDDVRRAEAGRA